MLTRKRKRWLLNAGMVAAVLVIVFAGVMFARAAVPAAPDVQQPAASSEGAQPAGGDEQAPAQALRAQAGSQDGQGSAGEREAAGATGPASASSPSGGTAAAAGAASGAPACTLEIRCDTILSRMERLSEAKRKLVPASGTLLSATAVQLEEGDTAFDVLKRTCKARGIQLEYSYVPLYGAYYIEGIGNLYEFDCGDQSGWMFEVDGAYPDYGCSKYEVGDGDRVVFRYTCDGLGSDVGA